MAKRLQTTTLIVLSAVALQALKNVVLYLLVNHAPEPQSEPVVAVYAMVLYVLILPEMLVSYEYGPHGLAAKTIMFIAGTIANAVVITFAVLIWRNIRNRKRTAASQT